VSDVTAPVNRGNSRSGNDVTAPVNRGNKPLRERCHGPCELRKTGSVSSVTMFHAALLRHGELPTSTLAHALDG
jgi:hypothetical protein